ncbi:MAG: PilZ domain-containing protein [Terracidiphilus sp.]
MESIEVKTCRAYNATRRCIVSSKVIVSDCANQPLTILKLLVESLGFKAEAAIWLTPLSYAPQLMRPFPFDLVYLDKNSKVVQAVELHPQVSLPPYDGRVATALVLPLRAISLSGTQIDDQLIVCAEEELEARIAELTTPAMTEIADPAIAEIPALAAAEVAAPTLEAAVAPAAADAPMPATTLPAPTIPKLPGFSFPGSAVAVPIVAAAVSQGTGFTVASTTTWQITNSTMAPALPEKVVEAAEEAAPSLGLSIVEVPEAEVMPAVAAGSIAPPEQAVREADATVSDPPALVADLGQAEALPIAEVSVDTEPEASVESAAMAAEKAESLSLPDATVLGELAATQEKAKAHEPTPDTHAASAPVAKIEIKKEAPATIGVRAEVGPKTTKNGSQRKKKDPFGVLKRFLSAEDPLPERRTTTRLLSPGLVAYDATGGNAKPCEVGDVSPTGVFVRTKERWRLGDLISLTLQRKNASEKEQHSRVVVQAGTVRNDADGVGLTFVLPENVEFRPWQRVHTKRSDETDGQYFVRELRTAKALGFLRHICPPAGEEIEQLLYERRSNKRVASAVAIALKAQELLAQNDKGESTLAHPQLVVRILEDGSWAEDEWIQQRWAGLLATSCTADGQDKSNLVFVEMLDKLTPIHLRILYAACRKGAEVNSTAESTSKVTIYCTADELIEAAGTHSLPRIQQTIGHLANFGLLAENNRPSYIHATEKTKTKTTPTSLGLAMFARCSGRR